MTDNNAKIDGNARPYGRECEDCGDRDAPLRNIKIRTGERELLCEVCFIHALENDRVHPADPRVETQGGRRV